MSESVVTGDKQKPAHLFKPGQSGNPAGRPKGARSKLTELFLKGMLADFETHGSLAIEKVRTEKPDQYLKVISAIIPKEITGEDGSPIAFISKIELVGVNPE